MSTPKNLELKELVKYCILDEAIINGIPVESCIGRVSERVIYNNVTIIVDVDITPQDIDNFFAKKESKTLYA